MEKCFASSGDKEGVIKNMQGYCDKHKVDYEINFDDGSKHEVTHQEHRKSKEEEVAELQKRLKELGV